MRLLAAALAVAVLVSFKLASTAHATAQWGVDTFPVTTQQVDPIVAPGVNPFGHLHVAFGNSAFSSTMTSPAMWLSSTNSSDPLDKSSRWTPALVSDADGTPAPVIKTHVYYRNPAAVRVQPLPMGLRVIAGDSHAMAFQSAAVVTWQCSTGGGFVIPPTSCNGGKLQGLVKFPNCWNGSELDSTDHKSHMAYMDAATKQCPSSHPIMVPQIQQVISWNLDGIAGYHLSSDNGMPAGMTLHADNWFLWDGNEMAALVADCLVGPTARDCGNITTPRT